GGIEQRRCIPRLGDTSANRFEKLGLTREPSRQRLVIGEVAGDQFGQARASKEAAGNARGEGLAAQPHRGAAAPYSVAQGGVRGVGKRVERKIGDPVAGEVLRIGKL